MKHLINKIHYLFLLVNSLVLTTRRDVNDINRGAWLHDKEGRVWYQEVQLPSVPKDRGDASRVKTDYREIFWGIPGLNGTGITRYPFPYGNWVIKVTFSSRMELNDVMKRDIIPPLLDGVPVIVRDTPATYALE